MTNAADESDEKQERERQAKEEIRAEKNRSGERTNVMQKRSALQEALFTKIGNDKPAQKPGAMRHRSATAP